MYQRVFAIHTMGRRREEHSGRRRLVRRVGHVGLLSSSALSPISLLS